MRIVETLECLTQDALTHASTATNEGRDDDQAVFRQMAFALVTLRNLLAGSTTVDEAKAHLDENLTNAAFGAVPVAIESDGRTRRIIRGIQ